MSAVSDAIDRPKPQGRSRASNGSALFFDETGIDGRSGAARRYRDVLGDMVAHIGGEATAAELLLIRRIATLAVKAEQMEAAMVAGQDLDLGEFTTACNTLRRLLQDIGLERRAKDVTPTLSAYLAGRK